jgi:hypothetical protein
MEVKIDQDLNDDNAIINTRTTTQIKKYLKS